MQDVIASVVSTKKKSRLKILVAVAITILSISTVGRNAKVIPRGSARTEVRTMAKYIDVDSAAYDYGTLADWLIFSVGPEPPVWTEPHIEELLEDFYVVPKSTPLADVVEVRHGRWKLHEDGSGTCQECGYRQKYIWDMDGWQNYCGHCGADMRNGGQNE